MKRLLRAVWLLAVAVDCAVVPSDVTYACKADKDCPPGVGCNLMTGLCQGAASSSGIGSTTGSAAASSGGASSGSASSGSASSGSASSGRTGSAATSGSATGTAGASTGTSTGATTGPHDAGPELVPLTAQGGNVSALLNVPTQATVLLAQAPYAGSMPRLSGAGGLYQGNGNVWKDISAPFIAASDGGEAAIKLLASDTGMGSSLRWYVYTAGGQFLMSSDDGASWAQLPGIPVNDAGAVSTSVAALAVVQDGVLLAADFAGVHSFTVGGAAWTTLVNGSVTSIAPVSANEDFLAATGTASTLTEYTSSGQVAKSYTLCGDAELVDSAGSSAIFGIGQLQPNAFVDQLPSMTGAALLNFTPLNPPIVTLALGHDASLNNEYFGLSNMIASSPLAAPAGTCGGAVAGNQVAFPDTDTLVTALALNSSGNRMLAGTTRGLFDVTENQGSIAPAQVASFQGVTVGAYTQGSATLYGIGNDFRVFQVQPTGLTALANSPVQNLPGAGLFGICAVNDDVMVLQNTGQCADQALLCTSCSISSDWPPAGSPPFGAPSLCAGFVAGSQEYFYAFSDPTLQLGTAYVLKRPSTTWTALASPSLVEFVVASPAATTVHPLVYLLAAAGSSASSDGETFTPLGAIANFDPSPALVAFAAVNPLDGRELALISTLGHVFRCQNQGTSLACSRWNGPVQATALAFDGNGDLWVTAQDSLYDLDGGTVLDAGEPLLSLGLTPGAAGRGGLFVSGTAHTFFLSR